MVADLLSYPKWQFYPSENSRHSFYLYYENSRWHFANENDSRATLHRTDIYRKFPFGALDIRGTQQTVSVNICSEDL